MARDNWAIALLVVMHIAGIIGLTFESSRALFEQLIPFNLIVSATLVFFFHKQWSRKFIGVALLIYISGFCIELFGVQTGLIFGNYQYGSNLGWKIKGTPLLIGLNWLMLSYSIWSILLLTNWKKSIKVIVSAMMMVFLDVFIEPVAIHNHMWSWEYSAIPIQNYVAWGFVSLGIFWLWSLLPGWRENKPALYLYPIQFMFFVIASLLI